MSFRRFIRSQDYPDQTATDLVIQFDPAISLPSDYELAILDGKITNTVRNVSAALGNNTLRYSPDGGTTWFTVTFPAGSYSVTDIETVFNYFLAVNGHTTIISGATHYPVNWAATLYLNRVQVTLDANYQLDFTVSNLWDLLGFLSQIYVGGITGSTFTAPNIAKITDASEAYSIFCDIVSEGIYVNQAYPQGVIKVVPGGTPGYAVSLKETNGNDLYFKLNVRRLTQMRLRVLDNNLRVADLGGERTNFIVEFKPIVKK